MEKNVLLKAEDVCKAFGPTRALVDVNIQLNTGEIRGFIGENGSGKSTFSSILAGAQKFDSGRFELNGTDYCPRNMVDAQNHGISMIVQEMGTISGISVAANVFAGRLDAFTILGIVNFKEINRRTNEILREIEADGITAEMSVDELNFEDRKIVEIARAMVCNPLLLIVDETTTALAQKGRTILFKLINKMYEDGKTVLFISHDLDELMEICTSVTVLRDGVIIDTLEKEEISVDRMRTLMVGREFSGNYFRTDYGNPVSTEVVLKAEQVSFGPLENIDLELRKGEILGIVGLASCGMHELGKVLFGIEKPLTGQVVLNNNVEIRNPYIAVNNKMAYVSKERDKEGITLNASIRDNIVLPSLKQKKTMFGFISNRVENELADRQIDVLSIKCRNDKQFCSELSGGNKQKVVFSKWLAKTSDIFILDCPTRGIDVGVKASMYKLLTDLKNSGKAVIMISEELVEAIGMSDRILVIKNGKIQKELMRKQELSEKEIINYMI